MLEEYFARFLYHQNSGQEVEKQYRKGWWERTLVRNGRLKHRIKMCMLQKGPSNNFETIALLQMDEYLEEMVMWRKLLQTTNQISNGPSGISTKTQRMNFHNELSGNLGPIERNQREKRDRNFCKGSMTEFCETVSPEWDLWAHPPPPPPYFLVKFLIYDEVQWMRASYHLVYGWESGMRKIWDWHIYETLKDLARIWACSVLGGGNFGNLESNCWCGCGLGRYIGVKLRWSSRMEIDGSWNELRVGIWLWLYTNT